MVKIYVIYCQGKQQPPATKSPSTLCLSLQIYSVAKNFHGKRHDLYKFIAHLYSNNQLACLTVI